MQILVSVCVLAFLTLPPQAQDAATKAPLRQHRLRDVLLDTPGDGNTWVLAPGYKMRLGTDAVEFIPYFGPRAPRNFPVRLRVASVRRGAEELPVASDAAPQVEGQRVIYARGAVQEVWDLRPDAAEQLFVVAPTPGRGDLVVAIDVECELARADAHDGLRWLAPGLGEVHYGDLKAYDGAARQVTAPSQWTPRGIELRVPAAFVDAAEGPITIDPIVRQLIPLGNTPEEERNADIAYDGGRDRWLVVWERVFSARDIDIIASRYSGSGNHIEDVAVASGTRESLNPTVATEAHFHMFLICWDEDRVADRVILARLRVPESTSQGNVFVAVDGANATNRNPQLGGTIALDSDVANFLLVCEETDIVGSDARIVGARVTAGANVESVFTIASATTAATRPTVSKIRRSGMPWLVTYHVQNGAQHELRAIAVRGNDVRGPSRLIGTGTDGPSVDVDGDGEQFVAVFARTMAQGDRDIIGVPMRVNGTTITLLPSVNLTRAEPDAAPVAGRDHAEPVIAFDGCRYTYLYLENATGSIFSVRAATFLLGAAPAFSDSHFPLTSVTDDCRQLAIAAEGTAAGDPGELLVAHDRISAQGTGLQGFLFHGTTRLGGVTRVPTGCGLIATDIQAQNEPALGARFRVRVDPLAPANTVIAIGGATRPLALCRGCSLGVFPIVLTVPGIALDLPIACDPALLGAEIAIQGIVVVNLGGCAPPNFPVPLVTTDTLHVVVR
jgi:hypothetical protein